MKKVRWGLFFAYCLFIVWYTILSREIGEHRFDLRFMWAYREMLIGHPSWKKDVIQNINNILFFVPFGLLMPIAKWRTVFICALFFTLTVEMLQYIGGFGRAELDDVICNTLGAIIGFWIWNLIRRILTRSSNET